MTSPASAGQSALSERSLLLPGATNKRRRESIVEYATHVEDFAPVRYEEPDKHYNLAGLTTSDFWLLCFSMWSCAFLSAFDGTIVATLLGPISSDFNATNLASWLGTSYLLSVCCFTPIYGRLCDIIGRQPSMLISLFFFSLGNVLCAVAPSMSFLIAARAIAGVGGGGLTSVGSTILSDIVPISYRGIFQGYGNILFGLGSGLGAPLGGIINDHMGWRWAFYLQIPLLTIAGLLIWFKVRYSVGTPSSSGAATPEVQESIWKKLRRIDWLGSLTLALFIGLALLAVTLVTSSVDPEVAYRWSDRLIVGMFIGSAFFFCLFIYVELCIAAEPILPVELLSQRTPVAVAINNFTISILSFGTLYSVPLFYTAVRLMSAAKAGAHLIPNSILGSVGSLGVGFVVRATGRYYWLTVFCGMFSILSSCLLATWDENTSEFWLWTSFGPMYFSMGAVTTLTIVALIADIGREHVAVATSLSYMFRTTGQVLGVSLSGALTQAVLQRELEQRITGPGAQKIITQVRESSDSIRTLPPVQQAAAIASYQRALNAVFVCSIVLSTIGVLSSMGIREIDMNDALRKPGDSDGDDDEA
ncbi:hypothetical protein CspeluHIS016_0305770 [Cutaneotrichosporon spelunceum]|uniref:Major facilitator superfamily (MFS) profile domain-containing protein n=1 Tax=Cutaneotrichosporon spelunceum TaxID=1672016 RepID=A0AAD3YCA0_9TREE|nr:hypothetical protein CspeluHIS016_0305770 [Cutaneotrichosporon spelunceum]